MISNFARISRQLPAACIGQEPGPQYRVFPAGSHQIVPYESSCPLDSDSAILLKYDYNADYNANNSWYFKFQFYISTIISVT